MTTATAQPPRTRITNEKHAPGNRAVKKIWVLENLIFHPRTGEEERAAAERMLDRAIAAAQKNGHLTTKQDGGDGTWHGYRLPDIRYGARYEEVKHLSTTEIAKRIRADIKLARKVEAKLGTATGAEVALTDSLTALATMPKQIKISVRTDYFSGGSAIRVNVYNLPEKGWGYVQETDMWGKPQCTGPGAERDPGGPEGDPRRLQLRRLGLEGRLLPRQLLRPGRSRLARAPLIQPLLAPARTCPAT